MREDTAKEYLKEQLQNYTAQHLERSKGRNMYVCPFCGSGTGKNKTGAFCIEGDHFKCFSCNQAGDIFDLIGQVEHLDSYGERIQRAAELYNVTIDAPVKPKKTAPAEPDYTTFYLQANKDLEKTDYRRGLSLETLNRFKVGYAPEWKHPKAESAPASPRLIIPTSRSSYLARDTRADLTEDQKRYSKQKVGETHIFNLKALWKTEKPVFIVEGEIDAMSICDVGGEAVGLGSISNRRALIKELETRKPKAPLIIALDNDAKGKEAAEDLNKELNQLNIAHTAFTGYGDHKDANEALNADREGFTAAIRTATEKAESCEAPEIAAEKEKLLTDSALYSMESYYKQLEESKDIKPVPTGYRQLDSLLDGGLYPGLYIVGANSSMGKTTFCLQAADYMAYEGQKVLIISLEMSRYELISKSVSRLTYTGCEGNTRNAKTTRGIMAGHKYKNYNKQEMQLIQDAFKEYKTNYAPNIWIVEGVGDIGVKEIAAKVEAFIKAYNEAPVVVIDYLQMLAPDNIRATDKQNMDKAVLELKRLSRSYNLPVIAISSFSRQNYKIDAGMSAFKESGGIEYGGDVLIAIQAEGMQSGESKEAIKANTALISDYLGKKEREAELVLMKNRNGEAWKKLSFTYRAMFNHFEECETFQGEKLEPLKPGEYSQSWEELVGKGEDEMPF